MHSQALSVVSGYPGGFASAYTGIATRDFHAPQDHTTLRERSFGANSDDGASRAAPGTSGSGAPAALGRSSAGAGGHTGNNEVLQSSKSAGEHSNNRQGGKKMKNMLVKAREKLLRGVDKTLSGGAIAAKTMSAGGVGTDPRNDPNDPSTMLGNSTSREQHQPSNNYNPSRERPQPGPSMNYHHQNRLAAPHFLVNAGKAGAAGMQSAEVTLQYYAMGPAGGELNFCG